MNMTASSRFEGRVQSKATLWAGRAITAIVALFLGFDGVTKLIRDPHVLSAMADLAFPERAIIAIGAVILVCTLLFLIPSTSMLGAILLTAHLGGAVAVQVRAGHPVFECVFPIIFGVLLWLGLSLRDPDCAGCCHFAPNLRGRFKGLSMQKFGRFLRFSH
jgi:DoxX-like protein